MPWRCVEEWRHPFLISILDGGERADGLGSVYPMKRRLEKDITEGLDIAEKRKI
jgi:hypothetical protein